MYGTHRPRNGGRGIESQRTVFVVAVMETTITGR
jgi:hypothetical protein